MLTPFLATLLLLAQVPAMPDEPITVLIAPPDTAGVPEHVAEFAQEHVSEQTQARGLAVARMKDINRGLSAARRRELLRCKRTELRCLMALGEAARSEVVLVAELIQLMDGYRVGTKIYRTKDGALLAEHLLRGVREDGMLDALTQSLDVVVPRARQALRPSSAPPPPVKPPPSSVTTPPVAEQTPDMPIDVKPGVRKAAPTRPLRPWAWAPAAGGAAFLGLGTYFMLQAQDKHQELEEAGRDIPLTYEEADDLARSGRRAQTLSRVAFGLGAAGLVTGAVFYLLPGKQSPVRPTASVGPGGGMVGVAGTLP